MQIKDYQGEFPQGRGRADEVTLAVKTALVTSRDSGKPQIIMDLTEPGQVDQMAARVRSLAGAMMVKVSVFRKDTSVIFQVLNKKPDEHPQSTTPATPRVSLPAGRKRTGRKAVPSAVFADAD